MGHPASCIAGIDIGGTNVKIGIIRPAAKPEVVKSNSILTQATDPGDVIVERIAHAVKELALAANVKLAGAGVGCPGLIAADKGVVTRSPNLPSLIGFPLRARLSAALGLSVEIQNDANAAALGEFLFGPARGTRNLIYLTLGTGVGGGVIADGKLLQGADNGAAELGHMKVDFDGAPCGCGKKGCAEAYVGAAGIARMAREALVSGAPTQLRPDQIDTKAISAAAAAGDAVAKQILERVGEYLGRLIAVLIDAFNPERVLLGGGASAAIDFLRPGIQRSVERYASFAETRDRAIIERAGLPDDINIIGAAAVFLHAHGNP